MVSPGRELRAYVAADRAQAPDELSRRAAHAEGGPTLIAARIDDKPGVGATNRDPAQIRDRFMRGLGLKQPPPVVPICAA
jgi:hypothetical protein